MRGSVKSHGQWRLLQLVHKLWFRATLFSLLAIATALAAIVLNPFIPDGISARVGADSVDNILNVIATSMLAVTIFSLSTMVSAYIAASSNISARTIRLLTQDSIAHTALGTFIGAFIFSLVGIVALSTDVYGEDGRVVLFVATVLVIVVVVITLLRWIQHVSELGQVAPTTDRIEQATAKALRQRHENPYLGGKPLLDRTTGIPAGSMPLYPTTIGYVQHIDMNALSDLAGKYPGATIYVDSLPGTFAERSRPLAWVQGLTDEAALQKVGKAFSIENLRSYEQDPRFGAAVLAEIASHALSTGVNDPGTAIDVIGRAVRVLAILSEPRTDDDDVVRYRQVHVPGIELGDLFDDFFRPIARDGAATIEVGIRLQKALHALARMGDASFRHHARHHSQQALQRALQALTFEQDRLQLRLLAAQIAAIDTSPPDHG